MTESSRPSLKPVLVFYLLACLWSWPFMLWMTEAHASWAAFPLPGFLKTTLMMWGPGVAALVCLWLFGKPAPPRTTLTGGRRWGSLAFFLAPLFALAALTAALAGPKPALGLIALFGPIGFINTLGEELGWRGFLQNSLQGLSPVKRYLLIGVLWEIWHWPMRLYFLHNVDLSWYAGLLPLSLSTLVFAFILGAAADRSRSLVVPVTLHFWINGVREMPALLSIPSTYVYGALAVALAYWAWLLWNWRPGGANAAPVLD